MFQRRHYEWIAARFKAMREGSCVNDTDCTLAAEWFANGLERDNPRFNRHMFLKACGVPSHQF